MSLGVTSVALTKIVTCVRKHITLCVYAAEIPIPHRVGGGIPMIKIYIWTVCTVLVTMLTFYFEAEGCDTMRELTSDEVSNMLMSNPDCTMPAKRDKNVVSINSRTKYLKREPPAVQKWAEMKRKRAKREDNQTKALKTSAANTPTITSMLKQISCCQGHRQRTPLIPY